MESEFQNPTWLGSGVQRDIGAINARSVGLKILASSGLCVMILSERDAYSSYSTVQVKTLMSWNILRFNSRFRYEACLVSASVY